ncbi:MAG: hypothetical protein IJ715_02590 [Bacilli bacterium]|nr:hypothetical protein [Bacilli bacterium]
MLDWRNNSFIGELDDVYTTLFHPTYWDNISDCKKCIDLTIEADRKRISEEMHNTIINSRIL